MGVGMIAPDHEDHNNRDEIRIMQASRADLSYFAPLYDRYFPRIYHYCLRRVESEEAAEDLTSVIFTRALTGVQDFAGGSVAAWLFRIAHNMVANHYRSRRPSISFDQSDFELASESNEPIEAVILAEQQRTLNDLMSSLSDEQRELLALKIAGGLTAEDIATVLGKSAGAVRVELHRIIKRMRTLCEERGLA